MSLSRSPETKSEERLKFDKYLTDQKRNVKKVLNSSLSCKNILTTERNEYKNDSKNLPADFSKSPFMSKSVVNSKRGIYRNKHVLNNGKK